MFICLSMMDVIVHLFIFHHLFLQKDRAIFSSSLVLEVLLPVSYTHYACHKIFLVADVFGVISTANNTHCLAHALFGHMIGMQTPDAPRVVGLP